MWRRRARGLFAVAVFLLLFGILDQLSAHLEAGSPAPPPPPSCGHGFVGGHWITIDPTTPCTP